MTATSTLSSSSQQWDLLLKSSTVTIWRLKDCSSQRTQVSHIILDRRRCALSFYYQPASLFQDDLHHHDLSFDWGPILKAMPYIFVTQLSQQDLQQYQAIIGVGAYLGSVKLSPFTLEQFLSSLPELLSFLGIHTYDTLTHELTDPTLHRQTPSDITAFIKKLNTTPDLIDAIAQATTLDIEHKSCLCRIAILKALLAQNKSLLWTQALSDMLQAGRTFPLIQAFTLTETLLRFEVVPDIVMPLLSHLQKNVSPYCGIYYFAKKYDLDLILQQIYQAEPHKLPLELVCRGINLALSLKENDAAYAIYGLYTGYDIKSTSSGNIPSIAEHISRFVMQLMHEKTVKNPNSTALLSLKNLYIGSPFLSPKNRPSAFKPNITNPTTYPKL